VGHTLGKEEDREGREQNGKAEREMKGGVGEVRKEEREEEKEGELSLKSVPMGLAGRQVSARGPGPGALRWHKTGLRVNEMNERRRRVTFQFQVH